MDFNQILDEFNSKQADSACFTAAHVITRHLRVITRSDTTIYVYTPSTGTYSDDGENTLKLILDKKIGKHANTRNINEILTKIRFLTTVPDNFFTENTAIALTNKTLDCKNLSITNHSPKNNCTTRLPVKFDEKADCPAIKQFFSEIVEADDVPLLEEIVGYLLEPGYPGSKAFILYGSGSNGKSVFCNLVKAFLSTRNSSAVPLHVLVNNRFASASMFGKLANFGPELSAKPMHDLAQFKGLTGGDIMRAEYKGKPAFEFVNRAKLFFPCNTLPTIRDETYATWRRLVIVNFPYRFTGENNDTHLLEKLTTPRELSGLLNLALTGLRRLRANNYVFSNELTAEETEELWSSASDGVKAWVNEVLVQDARSQIEKKEGYDAYLAYCAKTGFAKVGYIAFCRRFTSAVRNIQEMQVSRKTPAGIERIRVWRGVRFKDAPQKKEEYEQLQIKEMEEYAHDVPPVEG